MNKKKEVKMDENIKKSVLQEIEKYKQNKDIKVSGVIKYFLVTFGVVRNANPIEFQVIDDKNRNITIQYTNAFEGLEYQLYQDIEVITDTIEVKTTIKKQSTKSMNIFFLVDKNGEFNEQILFKIYKIGIGSDVAALNLYKIPFNIFVKEVKDLAPVI